jgi:hypothetical protein
MTKNEAYTEDLACEMWQLFGSFVIELGYSVWGNYSCSMYFPIQNIALGPEGQLWNRVNLKIGVRRRSEPNEVKMHRIPATNKLANIDRTISSPKSSVVPSMVASSANNLRRVDELAIQSNKKGNPGVLSTKVSFRAAAGKEGKKTPEGLIGLGFLGRSGPIWKSSDGGAGPDD